MPIYEYKCSKCGGVYEVIQGFSEQPLKTHEGCGGAVERLISPPALQFKGSGWYITDYARASKGSQAPKGDNGGKGDGAKGEGGKSEGGKSEGGKSEGGKSEGGKTETKTESKPASSGTSEKK